MSDYDIHSCGYYCDKPACIKAQRDELRDRLAAELPLVRVEEFVEMIKGKENFRGIPVMRTEWPLEDRWVKTYSGGKPNYTQPEPEPDCYGDGNVYRGLRSRDSEAKTIYTESKAEWVGLTDEERANCSAEAYGRHFVLCELIEAKLKEKNHG
jgi:hypothetical protein